MYSLQRENTLVALKHRVSLQKSNIKLPEISKLYISKNRYECSKGNFKTMLIYQTDANLLLQMKEKNFMDRFKSAFNSQRLRTQTRTQTDLFKNISTYGVKWILTHIKLTQCHWKNIFVSIHKCKCGYMCLYIYIYIYIYIRDYLYIYIHIRIHIYIHLRYIYTRIYIRVYIQKEREIERGRQKQIDEETGYDKFEAR